MCNKYNITRKEYTHLRYVYNLSKDKRWHKNPWLKEDDQFLIENYHMMSDEQLAKVLNKSTEATKMRRLHFNLLRKESVFHGKNSKKFLKPTNFTDEQKRNICNFWLTGTEIADLRRLYRCSDEELHEVFRQPGLLEKQKKIVEKYGCFPVTRTKSEINHWKGCVIVG